MHCCGETIKATTEIHFLESDFGSSDTIEVEAIVPRAQQGLGLQRHSKASINGVGTYIVLLMQKMRVRDANDLLRLLQRETEAKLKKEEQDYYCRQREQEWRSQRKRVCPRDATLCSTTRPDGNRLIQRNIATIRNFSRRPAWPHKS